MVIADWPVESRTTQVLLERGAECWPDRLAMRDSERQLSYADLLDETSRRGSSLRRLGIEWQEPVAFMLDNTLDHVLWWLGATYHGLVQVQINTAYVGRFLSHVINSSGARTILLEEQYVASLAEVVDDVPHLERAIVRGDPELLRGTRLIVHTLGEVLEAATDEAPEHRLAASDVYGILYTSGTTGLSKGVVEPHGIAFSYQMPGRFDLIDHDDVVGVFLPQFHIAGQWTGHVGALMVGASTAIVERFSVSSFWDDIRRFRITQTTLMATMSSFLWKQPPTEHDGDTTLRRVLMAPIMDYVGGFEQRFGVLVCSALGQTEASCPIVHPYGGTVPGGCGWIRNDFEARVVDEDGIDVEPGTAGELLTRPREPWSTMLEYKGDPVATVEKWRGLWMHHGDIVRQDETGQFFFVDRASDVIRHRGENISSLEVESEILRSDGVAAVAVVGVADSDGEDSLMAWVLRSPDSYLTEAELHSTMQARLPYFMVPRYLEIVDELPRTPTAKVMKSSIRAIGVRGTTWDARAHGVEARRAATGR